MAVFLVTWDLNQEKPNYSQARTTFINHLQRYPHIKDPGLDSVWFIQASTNADSLSADLRTKLDDNDKIIVAQLHAGTHQGWLQKAVWDWINPKL